MYDNNFLLEILQKLNITCSYEELDGFMIERTLLLNNEKDENGQIKINLDL